MMNRLFFPVAACVLLGLSGCKGYHNPFSPPGTIQQQRLSASVYDPYADNDAGPEIVGGRPRDYQKPWSEADRSRAADSARTSLTNSRYRQSVPPATPSR